ncbi:hypothetical protein [Lentisalinibacter sediminis]|uniref:hypothetical protein n=1 Tax=Lentisalinibacter sediminis TaxID=2992237 RepID=UPI00386FE53D
MKRFFRILPVIASGLLMFSVGTAVADPIDAGGFTPGGTSDTFENFGGEGIDATCTATGGSFTLKEQNGVTGVGVSGGRTNG